MTTLHESAPLVLALACWLIALPLVAHALTGLQRGLADPVAQHGWLAGIVVVALLWALPVRSPLGIEFGLLGSALFSVLFGYRRAVIGLTAAVALHTLLAGGAWLNLGINALLLAVFPAWLATRLQLTIFRRLPHNIFVFIFGNGLAVTLFVTALTGLLLIASGGWFVEGRLAVGGDHVAYALLLAWGEALISGMVLSSLVIFLPRTVLTYDQDTYLPPRTGSH